MVAGKQGELMVHTPQDFINNDPIKQLQTKYKEFLNGFKGWLAKQSLPVESAIVTITSAAHGTTIGGIMGTLTTNVVASAPPPLIYRLWPLSSKPRLHVSYE
ncbi:putative mitochondrial import inner membrane translocase subunit TIM22 [Helianthus anomalus]